MPQLPTEPHRRWPPTKRLGITTRPTGISEARRLARLLLMKEIRRIVAEAQSAGRIIRTGYHAGRLLRQFPTITTAFSLGRIIDEITAAAAAAGVTVEISREQ